MEIDELIVFRWMLDLGRPARMREIADGAQRWYASMASVQPIGLHFAQRAVASLTRAGLVVRASKTTYAATWGVDADSSPRPALPLRQPELRAVAPSAFGWRMLGGSRETVVDGFVYMRGGSTAVCQTVGDKYVGSLHTLGDGHYILRRFDFGESLADRYRLGGFTAYIVALDALRRAVAGLGWGWSMEMKEEKRPTCPACGGEVQMVRDTGYTRCETCDRTMIHRRDLKPFCSGHVETPPVDLKLNDPAGQEPGNLWRVAERLAALEPLVRGARQ